MDEKVLKIFKIKMFEKEVIKIGIINNKLSYIGFERDNIHDFYKNYKIRNVLKNDEFIKYIEYLKKFEKREDFELNFDELFLPNLTDKQIDILKELCKLKYGEYKTYSEFAKDINKVDHTRFIASCMSKNPILLLIPCHRLISKNLDIKYRSGREIKSFLLKNNF